MPRYLFDISFYIFLFFPIIVLLGLTIGKINAPYGKLMSSQWGSLSIPDKWGWLIMESPASIIFTFFFLTSFDNLSSTKIVFFIVWQFHYFYRSFIYPFRTTHSKRMPVVLMLAALNFQLVNTYFQAAWIYEFAPMDMYGENYLLSWSFILGLVLFLLGTFINRYSDHILKNLRNPGEKDYKIPYGGLFHWVSCPNYLGEIIIWLGWAVMLKSWIGFAFFLWTVANLAPRAIAAHKWYLKNFPNYPKDRKALIPLVL